MSRSTARLPTTTAKPDVCLKVVQSNGRIGNGPPVFFVCGERKEALRWVCAHEGRTMDHGDFHRDGGGIRHVGLVEAV